jgi:hypothetical protein
LRWFRNDAGGRQGDLLDYLRSVNELHARPVFHNALIGNCTANIRIRV